MPFRTTTALLTSIFVLSGTLTAAAQDRLKVVTTFTVLADMAANVAGDAADVVSITKPGAEIHGYEPTPQDIVRAYDADLILWNGMNLELWFEQFLSNLGDIPAATLSDGVDPISIAAGSYTGKPNPHAWMGLDNAQIYIDNIESALSENDPDNAATYASNAAAYKEELRATLEPLREAIADVAEDQRWLVTCEGAFSYLARDMGLRELYLWPMNADQVGTPQQVRAVIDGVRDNDIPVVFCESTVNTAPAEQVARETGAAYGGVLYVDSLSGEDGPVPTYLDLLRVTTTTVTDGLTGKANGAMN
ncbi:Periplasmic solute binding protein family [Sulfitobacter noctilucae]|uniref:metal ABC transporter substrate-binding protein n=1 Tax=Sulfitobacter noctilucae TaxID=1342302 RepID=UPI000469354D|nr:metal ABC transporter substrate-binding protein [Sulfitobacter noctilucae]KIN61813.1 Periplasmic solute binding protein family [Sulfitobacter noctilucae]